MKKNSRRPAKGWKQLNFQFFICIPSAKCAAISFVILSAISITLTILLFSFSSEIVQYSKCFDDEELMKIDEEMVQPVYVYLKFNDFYQNYRQYSKSVSFPQLRGNDDSSLREDCAPIIKLKDLDYPRDIENYENTKLLENSTTADPCGLVAASFINYTIVIQSSGEDLKIDSSGIEWTAFGTSSFKNTGEDQYLDKENKHFVVWMRIAATNEFLKFYGKIDAKMQGDYNISILKGHDYLDTDPEPCVVLSTANTMGGKNLVLSYTMAVCSLFSVFWCFFFIFLNHCYMPTSLEKAFNINLNEM